MMLPPHYPANNIPPNCLHAFTARWIFVNQPVMVKDASFTHLSHLSQGYAPCFSALWTLLSKYKDKIGKNRTAPCISVAAQNVMWKMGEWCIFHNIFLIYKSLQAGEGVKAFFPSNKSALFWVLFPSIFPGVLRSVAGYVTKYAGKRDRKEA